MLSNRGELVVLASAVIGQSLPEDALDSLTIFDSEDARTSDKTQDDYLKYE